MGIVVGRLLLVLAVSLALSLLGLLVRWVVVSLGGLRKWLGWLVEEPVGVVFPWVCVSRKS